MAKTSVINREQKRRETVKKFSIKRAELLKTIGNEKLTDEERYIARHEACRHFRVIQVRYVCVIAAR